MGILWLNEPNLGKRNYSQAWVLKTQFCGNFTQNWVYFSNEIIGKLPNRSIGKMPNRSIYYSLDLGKLAKIESSGSTTKFRWNNPKLSWIPSPCTSLQQRCFKEIIDLLKKSDLWSNNEILIAKSYFNSIIYYANLFKCCHIQVVLQFCEALKDFILIKL